MVKVSLKGGVWKNSEDEILKAAVQKYGKQQWARVASLLNRKTAKQAKARWHEWLDPSIKKTEWSRQEEEKLLHLAKLMPAQWKTIGPLVGRTASQCQEHYERLLDQAASSAGGSGGDATTDALRQQTALRPGQIDAHPETRPARPDPIDMDEDEMEMLQEARARLANTVGKKAKRKQREKILAQAKRLADLQKRRELKQAGLLSAQARKKASKRNRDIDLGVEIPFHKPAPAGFHSTESEDTRAESIRKKRLKQVDYHKVNEAQYRTRDREAAEAQKREQARLRVLEQSTEKYAQQEKALLEDEKTPARPRVGLALPAPSIQDEEWQAWHKEHQQKKQPPGIAGGGGVTAALMGDYTDRPLPTPMRTPASAGGASSSFNLTERATALRQLERGQTPLLTSASAMDEDEPEQQEEQDTKPSVRSTSRSVANRTPSRRDALGLNTGGAHHDDGASVGASTFASSRYVSDDDELRRQAREERRALKAARQQLEAALAALPAPQFDYELAAPDVETVDDDETDEANKLKRPKDQADVEAAERQAKRQKLEEEMEARSTVLKRPELPRPARIDPETVLVESKTYPEAALMVQKEMLRLLQHDAYAHPVVANKKKKQEMTVAAPPVPAITLEPMDVTALRNARHLLETETSATMLDKTSAANDDLEAPLQANLNASSEGAADWVCLKGSWQKATSDEDRLASLQSQFAVLKEATAALRKRNDKAEHKLSVVNGGYAKRSVALKDEILQTEAARQHACIEQAVFGRLQQQEIVGAISRVEKLQSEVNELKALEASLQKEYGDLRIERRRKNVTKK